MIFFSCVQDKVKLSLINSQLCVIRLKPNKEAPVIKEKLCSYPEVVRESEIEKHVIVCLLAWIHCPMVTNLVLSII